MIKDTADAAMEAAMPTKGTIQMHESPCDKCCGSGKVLDDGVYELVKHWRKRLGITAKTLSALARIPYTSYCKFENGSIHFSERRLRRLIGILTEWESEHNDVK